MTRSHTLQHLHGGYAEDKSDTFIYAWSFRMLQAGEVGFRGKFNQVPQRVWRDDREDVGQELAEAAKPELDLESFVHCPQQGVRISPLEALLVGSLHLGC